MATSGNTPQRPLWQQLGIWVIAIVASGGLITVGNVALTDGTPPPSESTQENITPDTPTPPTPEPAPAPPVDGEQGVDDPTPEAVEEENVEGPDEPVDYLTASEQLNTLTIAPRAPRDGYDREDQFGSAWIDVDNNGCDTRNDILRRDLDDTVIDSRCRVLSGVLLEPITGNSIDFQRGQDTSALVQIDHIVSLSNAWQTGAQELSRQQRIAFANEPLNLMAISGALNQQKGDSDAASWLPPRSDFWCEYVARQVGVKSHYSLWVTQAEHDQMERVLRDCPTFPALTPSAHKSTRPGTVTIP
jgi:hypothetical protein